MSAVSLTRSGNCQAPYGGKGSSSLTEGRAPTTLTTALIIEQRPWAFVQLGAMCGRLAVGKGFLIFSHSWSELPCVRPTCAAFHIAAGHNALRRSGPGQFYVLERRHGTKWVVPIFGPTGMGALYDQCPFQPGCAGLSRVRCPLTRRLALLLDRFRYASSSPRRCARPCWLRAMAATFTDRRSIRAQPARDAGCNLTS